MQIITLACVMANINNEANSVNNNQLLINYPTGLFIEDDPFYDLEMLELLLTLDSPIALVPPMLVFAEELSNVVVLQSGPPVVLGPGAVDSSDEFMPNGKTLQQL